MEDPLSLPDAIDFGAYRNNPDANWAWNEFDGLSIDQACEKLASNPDCYSEAFIWMGKPAFAYYFSAIDRYLRRYPDGVDPYDVDDSSASLIAGGLITQFLASDIRMLTPILEKVHDLTSYVRSNLTQLATCPEAQVDIDASWQILEAQLSQISCRITPEKK